MLADASDIVASNAGFGQMLLLEPPNTHGSFALSGIGIARALSIEQCAVALGSATCGGVEKMQWWLLDQVQTGVSRRRKGGHPPIR